MRRRTIVILLVIAGFALQGVAFLAFGAPLGTPSGSDFSNPRVPFASLIFVVGVALVFLSVIAYELIGAKRDE